MALFLHKSYILLNFVSKFKYQLIYRMNIHKLGSLYGNALQESSRTARTYTVRVNS